MQTTERHKPRPVLDAERRAEAAERRASAAETAATAKAEAARLATENADLRQDRDRWRAQAERLAGALERLKGPIMPVPSKPCADVQGDEAVDLLEGAAAIGEAFGWKARRVHHLIDSEGLPTFKLAGKICARRAAIATWLGARAGNGGL